jgi:hypothetical protein
VQLGKSAPLGLDNAADDHPQAARRCAPHNQRMQQPISPASKLAGGLAADPEHYYFASGVACRYLTNIHWYVNEWEVTPMSLLVKRYSVGGRESVWAKDCF